MIENLVQLLVAAVKESRILNDQCESNSPEDILKRKRLQVDFSMKKNMFPMLYKIFRGQMFTSKMKPKTTRITNVQE